MKSIIIFLVALTSIAQAAEKTCDGVQKAKIESKLQSTTYPYYKVLNKDGSAPESIYRLIDILSYEADSSCPLNKELAEAIFFGLDNVELTKNSVTGAIVNSVSATIVYDMKTDQGYLENVKIQNDNN